MGKNVTPPPTPDFAGAAAQQTAANERAAISSAFMSNPNIITPTTVQDVQWKKDESTNDFYQPLVTQKFNPETIAGRDLNQAQTYNATAQKDLGLLSLDAIANASNVLDSGYGSTLNYLTQMKEAGDLPGVTLGIPTQTENIWGGLNPAGSPDHPSFWQQGTTAPTDLQMMGTPDLSQYGQATFHSTAPYAINTGPEGFNPVQGSINTSGVAGMPVNPGMTGQQAIMSRLTPQISQERTSLETQLTNQGLRPGTEAWDNAMRVQNQRETDLLTQAALQGIGLDFTANQQGFGQAQTQGQFANAAQAQQAQQALALMQGQNQAQGQAYDQEQQLAAARNASILQNQQAALMQQQAANQAYSQQFGQGLALQDFNNQATQQNYANNLAYVNANNQAQAQLFAQQQQAAQFGNAAQQQLLGQYLQMQNLPLNQITALMSGQQIQNPTFQAYQGQSYQPGNIQQAVGQQANWAQNIYNQQVAQANAMTQGLFQLGSGIAGAFTGSKFLCWIAEAIYGKHDYRTHLIRAWLLGPVSEHPIGKLFVKLYRKYGERVAQHKWAVIMLRPLFARMLKKAERWAEISTAARIFDGKSLISNKISKHHRVAEFSAEAN